MIVGPDGALWYAGNGDSHIGRIDPANGDLRRFDVPVRDPHTLQFAPDGMLWFTAQGANRIGRLDPRPVTSSWWSRPSRTLVRTAS